MFNLVLLYIITIPFTTKTQKSLPFDVMRFSHIEIKIYHFANRIAFVFTELHIFQQLKNWHVFLTRVFC
jgi:hypothetical protein